MVSATRPNLTGYVKYETNPQEIYFYIAISNTDKVRDLDYKNEKDYRRLGLSLENTQIDSYKCQL